MIYSILDTDLYKLTMQQAVWKEFPTAEAGYTFIERHKKSKFTTDCVEAIRQAVHGMSELALTSDERAWLVRTGWFGEDYLDWLEDYRFRPHEVSLKLEGDDLVLSINGPWVSTILWETPLLAIISETYFQYVDREWEADTEAYAQQSEEKSRLLTQGGCHFSDFGTRRRRSLPMQRAAIEGLLAGASEESGSLTGTSNLMFAREFELKPVGTVAHEWIMALGALEGIEHANEHALQRWLRVYEPEQTIGLTDTYTVHLFMRDFDRDLAESIAGIRHDSGSPFEFVDRFAKHYQALGVDSSEKRFVFSDGIDVEKAIAIQRYAADRCQPAFGIGTHLTNDFPGSPALDIVIKLTSCNGHPAVKTGDGAGKATGDENEAKRARRIIRECTGREV